MTTYVSIVILAIIFILQCSQQLSAVRSVHSFGQQFLNPSTVVRESRNQTSAQIPSEQWFEQQLDHFNYADTRTWKQRYFVNDLFYSSGGPVFVFINGENPADPNSAVQLQWVNWAKEFGALCLLLEHRYYGESHPTEDLSVENLKYLSSDQALADVALFRSSMAEKYGTFRTKWIFFGGSYAGCLTAWMRLKYPHLVDGAVASSAPVKAVLDFSSYISVVVKVMSHVNKLCTPAIAKAVKQMENALKTESGWAELTKTFRLCSPLNGLIKNDVMNLYQSLATNFEISIQYYKDNIATNGNSTNINTMCNIMTNQSIGSEMDRYAAVNNFIMEQSDENCLDYTYSSFINAVREFTWNGTASGGVRQYDYQICTEFGYFEASDYPNQPFGQFSLDFLVKQCADLFGPKFNYTLISNGIKQTNINYGGKDIRVTKVVFSNGSNDPWHLLGVLKDPNPEAKAILIQGTAHCADMYPPSPSDPPQLTKARKIIGNQIKKWIS